MSEPKAVLARPESIYSREGMASFFKKLTGRDATPEQLDRAMATLAAAGLATGESGPKSE